MDSRTQLEIEAENRLAAEKWAEGLELADRAVVENPSSEFAHRLRFIALRNLNRNDDAIEAARRSIELAPLEGNGFYLLATVLFERGGDDAEALKSIELEPTTPLYRRFRIRVLMVVDRSRVEAAMTELEQLQPLHADLVNLRGCFAEARSLTEAQTLYRAALQLDANDVHAKQNLQRTSRLALWQPFWRALLAVALVATIAAAFVAWWAALLVPVVTIVLLLIIIPQVKALARTPAGWEVDHSIR